LNYEKYLEAIGYGKAPEDIMYIDIELELLAVGTLGQGEVLDGFPPIPSWVPSLSLYIVPCGSRPPPIDQTSSIQHKSASMCEASTSVIGYSESVTGYIKNTALRLLSIDDLHLPSISRPGIILEPSA
jgi:hypothetical protein